MGQAFLSSRRSQSFAIIQSRFTVRTDTQGPRLFPRCSSPRSSAFQHLAFSRIDGRQGVDPRHRGRACQRAVPLPTRSFVQCDLSRRHLIRLVALFDRFSRLRTQGGKRPSRTTGEGSLVTILVHKFTSQTSRFTQSSCANLGRSGWQGGRRRIFYYRPLAGESAVGKELAAPLRAR